MKICSRFRSVIMTSGRLFKNLTQSRLIPLQLGESLETLPSQVVFQRALEVYSRSIRWTQSPVPFKVHRQFDYPNDHTLQCLGASAPGTCLFFDAMWMRILLFHKDVENPATFDVGTSLVADVDCTLDPSENTLVLVIAFSHR